MKVSIGSSACLPHVLKPSRSLLQGAWGEAGSKKKETQTGSKDMTMGSGALKSGGWRPGGTHLSIPVLYHLLLFHHSFCHIHLLSVPHLLLLFSMSEYGFEIIPFT